MSKPLYTKHFWSLVRTSRLRVKNGLHSIPLYLRVAFVNPLPGGVRKGPGRFNLTFFEDRLKSRFLKAFSGATLTPFQLAAYDKRWQTHPVEAWVKEQIDLMKKDGMTENESWAEMMRRHRRRSYEWHLERELATTHAMELGVPTIDFEKRLQQWNDGTINLGRKYMMADMERKQNLLMEMCDERILDAEDAKEEITPFGYDDIPKDIDADTVRRFVELQPQYEKCFDEFLLIDDVHLHRLSGVTPDMQKEFEEEARKLAQEEEDARLRGEIKEEMSSEEKLLNKIKDDLSRVKFPDPSKLQNPTVAEFNDIIDDLDQQFSQFVTPEQVEETMRQIDDGTILDKMPHNVLDRLDEMPQRMHDVGPADPFGIPGLTKDDLKKMDSPDFDMERDLDWEKLGLKNMEDEEMCVEMLDDQLTRALKEAAEYPANLAQGDFKQADYADLAEEDEGDGDSETPSQNRENMPDRND